MISRNGAGARGSVVAALLAAAAIVLISAASATAATEPFGPKRCLTGSAAAQCDFILGVATSPVNGHLYVVDRRNVRVNEFTAWGEFVKSWGWGVDDGSAELQTCTTESGCQKGLEGTGVGQFEGPAGIAVDSAGNIYVTDPLASRVQKFDPAGNFLLMFGGEVDQGPNHPGDVCTAAFVSEGDTCGAGTPGTGDGQFSPNWAFSNNIATSPADQVYVGDKGRIHEFDTEGNFVRDLPDPDEVLRNGTPAEDKVIGSIAVDPLSGDIYMAYSNSRALFESARPGVYRIDEATGDLLDTLTVEKPANLATDSLGNVYVFDQLHFSGSSGDPANHGTRILKIDSAGDLVETIAEAPLFEDAELEESFGIATGSFCFSADQPGLYVGVRNEIKLPKDFVQAYGPNPDPAKCEPPDVPPSINAQFASSVGEESAVVKAEINPHYFTGTVGSTTYYVQWGTAECIGNEGFEGACAQTTPAPPGAALDSPPADENLTTDGVALAGLAPLTTYRFRFVAERERATGEDPPVWIVIGAGGVPGVEGADAAFTTRQDETIEPCSNDSFREDAEDAGMHLRDCRAYELVSPLDKAGGDIQARLDLALFDARVDQASTSGNAITFSASRAFGDPESAPFSSQYLTRREAISGWHTEAISPPQEGEAFVNPLLPIDNLYRAFNPDLTQSWLYTYTEPVLGTGGLAGHPNIYRRDSASGSFGACTTAVPFFPGDESHGPQLQGYSADGDVAVFRTENKLTSNASEKERENGERIYQLYVCAIDGNGTGTVRLLSLLPSGQPSELENTAGGPTNEGFQFDQGRTATLTNAVSSDGTKVFWTATSTVDGQDPGALYLRSNPAAEQSTSGACDEAGKACTTLISAGPARFWTAADDGSIAIFSEGGDLNEYEVSTEETRPIAEEVVGLVGSSEDVSRIYFLSEDNIEGEGKAGEPNLYLYERGVGTSFIATLSAQDASQRNPIPSPGNAEPAWHTARVTPDGSAVAFMSNDSDLAEEVAGYDNIDQTGGTPAAEIYHFEIGGQVVCVSCNRTGQRPQGREVQNKFLGNNPPFYAASMLPTWLNSLYAPRVLSDDGNRIFFEAFESLSPQDTNDKADVYQWEALGSGNCEGSDSAFDPQSQGCLSVISSGRSSNDSQFVDASPSGDDVFIRTASSLVSWDPGAIDIYDARVNGGFPTPPTPAPECQGEGCQPSAIPPPGAPPVQTNQPGPGNVKQTTKPKRCHKGTHKVKRKGKVRCVKNKKKHKAGKSRRVAR